MTQKEGLPPVTNDVESQQAETMPLLVTKLAELLVDSAGEGESSERSDPKEK